MKTKKKHKKAPQRTFKCYLSHTLILFMTALSAFAVLGFLALAIIVKGPSMTARDLFVNTVMETRTGSILARLYLSSSEISSIQSRNSILPTYDVTDTTKIHTGVQGADTSLIEVQDVSGSTFKGKMMIVHDPSRLSVATLNEYSHTESGKTVSQYVQENGAVAGINGGAFEDINSKGLGGMPLGLVIQNGELRYGKPDDVVNVIGFDQNDKLVVGNMTAQEALDMGLRDAVSFGPVLIVNGKAAEVSGSGGGLNPRTAIGQREDGAVLLLVLDGRQAQSLGASYSDVIKVMQDFGAVNAANLDGGSSTVMVYENEIINSCVSMNGQRTLPTAFIVK